MKISKGYIKTAFEVIDKRTGEHYDCFLQDYEYYSGEHKTRINIGINGWHRWNFIHFVDEDSFNKNYEIV